MEPRKKHAECSSSLTPVRDTLDVINGKWKLQILISMRAGNTRFKEIERSIPRINPKVLSKELKELELHKLIKRNVYDESPVLVEYTLLPYAETLENVIHALREWGTNHRKHVIGV